MAENHSTAPSLFGDAWQPERRCTRCKLAKPITEFSRGNGKDGKYYRPHCRECRNLDKKDWWRKNHARRSTEEWKEKKRRSKLRFRYGMTPADFDKMLEAQGGLCAICRKPETRKWKTIAYRLAVDHDHETGKVRGLLCVKCNAIVGSSDAHVEVLRAAIDYLIRNGNGDGNGI